METGRQPRYQLSVNAFDRTATLLIALLVMVGVAVLGLSIVFFANKFGSPIHAIEFVPREATSATANQGVADQPEPPGIEEAAELAEPQLMDTLDALESLAAMTDAMFADESVDSLDDASKGEGLGDARQAGPGGDGVVERVPRWERWKIRFEPESSEDFSAWLDFHKIRVGVLGRDNQVHLAYDFTKASPSVEAADPQDYVAWGRTIPADGPMPALTRALALSSGVAKFGRITLLFFPFEVEAELYLLEDAKNPYNDPNRIRETVFTVVRAGAGFEFEVIDQKYF